MSKAKRTKNRVSVPSDTPAWEATRRAPTQQVIEYYRRKLDASWRDVEHDFAVAREVLDTMQRWVDGAPFPEFAIRFGRAYPLATGDGDTPGACEAQAEISGLVPLRGVYEGMDDLLDCIAWGPILCACGTNLDGVEVDSALNPGALERVLEQFIDGPPATAVDAPTSTPTLTLIEGGA